MVVCAVFSCKNNSKRYLKKNQNGKIGITFHGFPKDKTICQQWIQQCSQEQTFNIEHAKVCSEHFTEAHFERDLKSELLKYVPYIRKLKKDAIPTEKLELIDPSSAQTMIVPAYPVNAVVLLNKNDAEANTSSDNITSIKSIDIETLMKQYNQLHEENVNLKRENINLKRENNNITNANKYIKKIFTPGQIKVMEKSLDTDNGLKRIKWEMEDISKAISLYVTGPRAYRWLLQNKYPLPSESTIKKYHPNK